MGGGAGGRGPTLRELQELEEIAHRKLREGAQPARRNVFLSFAAEDLDEVNLLRAQSKNEQSEIEFNDWSLKDPFESDNAEYIRRGIRERIRQSSIAVVYVSENTVNSKWVDWEVRESVALGKAVIAVHKGEQGPSKLPPAIRDNKIRVIPWRDLAEALKQVSS